ncbi:MAG: flagellar protein FlaG [Pseudohongiellaceae bacterium]
MPSLERIDIRGTASGTRIAESDQSNKQRQDFAGNGNFMPMALGSHAAQPANSTELDQAIEAVAGYIQNITRDINFSVDADTREPVVTVVDQESGKVIRQIPTEEMLEISRGLEDAQRRNSDKIHKGLLFEGEA